MSEQKARKRKQDLTHLFTHQPFDDVKMDGYNKKKEKKIEIDPNSIKFRFLI